MSPFPRAALRCPLKSVPRPALQLVAGIRFNAVAKLSTEDARTGLRRRDSDQAAALFDHGGPVVVPVRMLSGNGAVVLNQWFHRLGQADDLDIATDLCPVAEEPVIEHTHTTSPGGRAGRSRSSLRFRAY
jgi:hypothetical protein